MVEQLSLDDRKEAVREFLAAAEDPAKARAWIIECLNTESDAELLDWLADFSPTSTNNSQ